jgi:hypothetical protein
MGYFAVTSDNFKSLFSFDKKELSVLGNHFFDFGLVYMSDRSLKHQFVLKNTSSKSIVLNNVLSFCDCISLELQVRGSSINLPRKPSLAEENQNLRINISPDEEFQLNVHFLPSLTPNLIGPLSHRIFVMYNGDNYRELIIRGRVKP